MMYREIKQVGKNVFSLPVIIQGDSYSWIRKWQPDCPIAHQY